jgi:hypothetical protein
MNTFIVAAIRCSLLFVLPAVTYAGSAQWNLNPISGDWNTAANWTPTTVPNGSADVATFALSSTTDVSISENTEINSIFFTPAASNPYTISAQGLTLTISGSGNTNDSEVTQNFFTFGLNGVESYSPTAPRQEAMSPFLTRAAAQRAFSTAPLLATCSSRMLAPATPRFGTIPLRAARTSLALMSPLRGSSATRMRATRPLGG